MMCPKCLKEITETKKPYFYTLSCGHSFHTDCIVSWFRQKKDTCPCCRNKGKIHINQEIKDMGWESLQDVQDFLNSDNPTKEQIVKAYYIRDINMNIGIQECFESCVRGLGIHPDQFKAQIKQRFAVDQRKLCERFIRNCLLNPDQTNDFSMSIHFNEYLAENLESKQYEEKVLLYKTLETLKNENNHKGLYESIDINNLLAFGW